MKKIALIIIWSTLLCSCDLIRQQQQGTPIAQIGNHALYRENVESLLITACTHEDTINILNDYIQRWAKDVITYDAAQKYVKSKNIERRVEEYRQALYNHEYKQHLLQKNSQIVVSEDSMHNFYDMHPELFRLKETIVKGILLIIPKDAPHQKNLHEWLSKPTYSNLEQIEKYAYQNAHNYELFVDNWNTLTKILIRIPMEESVLPSLIRCKSQIEYSDSINTYLLQVTDKHFAGELMPYDYAKTDIKKLMKRQSETYYLQHWEQDMFDQAIKNGDLKIQLENF